MGILDKLFSSGKPDVEKLKARRDTAGLIAALSHDDENVRGNAAEALANIKVAEAVEPLIRLLRDPEWPVRALAARALGSLLDARAREPLAAALEDEHERVKAAAAFALGRFGDARAVKQLIVEFQNDRWDVQSPTILALTESLVNLGDYPTPNLREIAALLLARIGGDEAMQAVREYRARKGMPG